MPSAGLASKYIPQNSRGAEQRSSTEPRSRFDVTRASPLTTSPSVSGSAHLRSPGRAGGPGDHGRRGRHDAAGRPNRQAQADPRAPKKGATRGVRPLQHPDPTGAWRRGRLAALRRFRLPCVHLEQTTVRPFVVKAQHDLIAIEYRRLTVCPFWKLRIDQRDDELESQIGILAHDREQVDLLTVVQRLEDAVVVGEARRRLLKMSAQDSHIKRYTEQLPVAVPL